MPREGTGTVITSMLHALQATTMGLGSKFPNFHSGGMCTVCYFSDCYKKRKLHDSIAMIVSFCTSLWWRRAQENLNSPQILECQNAPIFDHLWVTWQSAEVATNLPKNIHMQPRKSPPFWSFLHEHLGKGTSNPNQISMLRVVAVYFFGV